MAGRASGRGLRWRLQPRCGSCAPRAGELAVLAAWPPSSLSSRPRDLGTERIQLLKGRRKHGKMGKVSVQTGAVTESILGTRTLDQA